AEAEPGAGAAASLGPESLQAATSGAGSREAEETPFEKELRLLANQDPAAAAAWAASQPAGSARDEALFSLSSDWAAAEPVAAADSARVLLPEARQGEFLRVV